MFDDVGGNVLDSFSFASVFFFFQAEDGIRDSSVTGVQTCALPIFISAQVAPQCQRVLGLGQGVQVPAIQLPELLAELADVETDVSRQSGPVRVPLFDAHGRVLQAHEDLGV